MFILCFATIISCEPKEDISAIKQKLIEKWKDISYGTDSEQELTLNQDGSFRLVQLDDHSNLKSEISGTWGLDRNRFIRFKYNNLCSRYDILRYKKTLVLDHRLENECNERLFSGYVIRFKKM